MADLSTSGPNVGYIRPELQRMLLLYRMITDCLVGETAVRAAGVRYLPFLDPEDTSAENKKRYDAYILRAVFYNVTRRTLYGLVGQIFQKPPQVEVPDALDIIIDDATGSGLSLTQLVKRLTNFTVALGRSGVLVDFPNVADVVTKDQVQSGKVRPTLMAFPPGDIVNWRTVCRNGITSLSLVVLQETYITSDDGFEAKEGMYYRVLRLIDPADRVPVNSAGEFTEVNYSNGYGFTDDLENAASMIYQVEFWSINIGGGGHIRSEVYYPMDSGGVNLTFIPFKFIGSENNDTDCDNPPLADLASLNISHWRNSADYEESVHLVGQPTPVFTGLTEQWVNDVLKGTIALGSRTAIYLPPGAAAQILQAAPNAIVKEAMDTKERQMVALGAKLVEQRQVQRTATEATMDKTSETSALSTCADNVGTAVTEALQWAALFLGGVDADAISYKLSTDFDLSKMGAQDVLAVVSAWNAHALAKSEMRDNLRRGGIATLDDDDYQKQVDEEQDAAIQVMSKFGLPPAGTPGTPGNQNDPPQNDPNKPPASAGAA